MRCLMQTTKTSYFCTYSTSLTWGVSRTTLHTPLHYINQDIVYKMSMLMVDSSLRVWFCIYLLRRKAISILLCQIENLIFCCRFCVCIWQHYRILKKEKKGRQDLSSKLAVIVHKSHHTSATKSDMLLNTITHSCGKGKISCRRLTLYRLKRRFQ
jgi:hypothetical protein